MQIARATLDHHRQLQCWPMCEWSLSTNVSSFASLEAVVNHVFHVFRQTFASRNLSSDQLRSASSLTVKLSQRQITPLCNFWLVVSF